MVCTTLRWRGMDSNHQYRVVREGIISGSLDTCHRKGSTNESRYHRDSRDPPWYCWFESISLQRRVGELSVPPCGDRRERAWLGERPDPHALAPALPAVRYLCVPAKAQLIKALMRGILLAIRTKATELLGSVVQKELRCARRDPTERTKLRALQTCASGV